MTGTPEPKITDEMIEKGARSLAGSIAWDDHAAPMRTAMRLQARAVLEAALAGYTVVQLPEHHGVDDGIHVWVLPSGEIQASQGAGEGLVWNAAPTDYLLPDEAEQYGAALIAAGREARRLASVGCTDADLRDARQLIEFPGRKP